MHRRKPVRRRRHHRLVGITSRRRQWSRLAFEPLEARHLLATLIVNDDGGGDHTSVAAAIAAAMPNDTIQITGGADRTHTEQGISVNKNLTIEGAAGATQVIVQAHAQAGMATDRVLTVNSGFTVSIDNLTIRNGNIAGSGGGISGGGIYNGGTLMVNQSTISGNTASGIFSVGGGIYNRGALTVTNSTLNGNTSSGSGGGIYNGGGTLTVTNSTLSGNTASFGGGIYNGGGTLTVSNSTLSGNMASSHGGIFNGSTATVNNTIVAGSQGGDLSGTFSGSNNLVEDGSGSGLTDTVTGDPLLSPLQNNGGPTKTHALTLGSPAIDAGDNDAVPAGTNFDQRGNPFGRIADGGVNGSTVDIGAYERQTLTFVVDTLADENDVDYSPGDLSLREAVGLANGNVGPDTITFAPGLTGTITLDHGELAITDAVTITGPGAANLSIDAQHNSRIFDVGAGSFDVTLNGLTLTGGQTPTNEDGGAIRFGHSGADNTGTLHVTSSTISGNSADGIGGGIRTRSGSVSVTSSTISGNSASSIGGGISAFTGSVSVTSSTISGNSASDEGGGIYTRSGSVSVTSSTISGNSASARGGGIYTYNSGPVSVTSSTISGNSAGDEGGGIYSGGQLTIDNSTIFGNTAGEPGGGVYLFNDPATIRSSIIAGNSDDGTAPDIEDRGNNITIDFSLVGDNTGSGLNEAPLGIPNVFNNLIGQPGPSGSGVINPQVGPLQHNGGPTQTHALLPGSPAIDKGNANGRTTDQRGFGRTFDHPEATNGAGGATDMGAFEVGLVVTTADDELDADISDPNDLSLREAINFANNNAGGHDITFDPSLAGLPINLTLGQLSITDEVAIRGLGANNTTIDGQRNSRIFDVGAGSFDVILNGLTLTGGQTPTNESGGAIRFGRSGADNTGTLHVTSSTISGNSASTRGGGIYTRSGSVSVTSSTISGNSAGSGGGIYTRSGSVSVTSSTISGNSASGFGGGILNSYGSVSVSSSTISGNSAGIGGGILTFFSGSVSVTNSTVSGNSASVNGGGIITGVGSVSITSSTISGNSASGKGGGIFPGGQLTIDNSTIFGNSSGGPGGGVYLDNDPATIRSSIIAGNSDDGTAPDIEDRGNTITISNSLVGDNTGSGLTEAPLGMPDVNGNLIGDPTGSDIIDPLLGPLGHNGGPTQTHALLPGSPAIDAVSTILSTNFDGRTVNDDTASNITYTLNGVADPGDLTAVEGTEEAPDQLVGLFDTDDASSHFAPDLNTDNEDNWSLSVPLALTVSSITIDDVVLDGDHFDNSGMFQIANRDTDFIVSITGSASGEVATQTKGTGLVMTDWSVTFFDSTPPIVLSNTETWTLTIATTNFPNSGGNNTGLDGFTVNGSIQPHDQRGAPRNDGHGVDMGAFELQADHVFVVNSTGDASDANAGDGMCDDGSGNCTLRSAIEEANALPNIDPNAPDAIFFDIAGSGPHVIQPLSPLPAVTETVVIDGTSEPDFAGTPIIELDGTGAGANTRGLFISSGGGGSTIRGLAINRFGSDGVLIANADGVVLEGNHIGTDPAGTATRANARGVVLSGATNTMIGGATAGAGNTISGNSGIGVLLTAASNNNILQGNRIGTATDAMSGLANGGTGIRVQGSSTGNTIGGATTGAGNIISGNSGHGVFVSGSAATGNAVQGNLIGTNAAATVAIGNTQNGVFFSGAPGNTIGGAASGAGNAISGNSIGVLLIGNSTGTMVQGNAIGTNPTGAAAIPNRTGVVLSAASNAMIGGSALGAGNLISGNTGVGVLLTASSNNMLQGNLVGTAIDGETPLANGGTGLRLQVSSTNNTIGGAASGAGNTISGNGGHGIVLANGGTTGNTIAGNQIGIDRLGTTAAGNAQSGVFVSNAPGNMIGGTANGAGNTISGNSVHGILLTRTGTTNNVVAGNRIGSNATGVSPVPNLVDGIFILNSPGNTIGGAAPGAGNLITASGVHGVVVSGLVSTGNTISANSIFGNTLLGIDLDTAPADPGRTVNDAGDADAGPNNVQNFPLITAAELGSGTLDVTFSVDSTTGNSAYDLNVEFFLADSLHGEGQTFLDAVTYTAANAGLAVMETITIPAGVTVNIGDQVLATATDEEGNTSEFSLSRTVAAPLMAAGGEASQETRVESQEPKALSADQLQPVVGEAIVRLQAAGLAADLFTSIDVSIADLPGATLGLATPTSIVIDTNAAGYGWYVSRELRDESREPADSDARSLSQHSTLNTQLGFDLLTVVMHELGHVAGLPDLYDPDEADDLMFAWLEPGVRKTSLEASIADRAFAQI